MEVSLELASGAMFLLLALSHGWSWWHSRIKIHIEIETEFRHTSDGPLLDKILITAKNRGTTTITIEKIYWSVDKISCRCNKSIEKLPILISELRSIERDKIENWEIWSPTSTTYEINKDKVDKMYVYISHHKSNKKIRQFVKMKPKRNR